MKKTEDTWTHANTPSGEHLWEGEEHIAYITGPGATEVAKLVVEMHNNPQYKVASELYEILKMVRDNAVLQKQENGYYLLKLKYSVWQDACAVLTQAEDKEVKQ